MYFAFYQSKGLISRLIQWFTRSRYSHVAIIFDDGIVFEAVERGFVRAKNPSENHGPGIVVDIFGYIEKPTAEQITRARAFCESIEGRKYDYLTVLLGFPFRVARDLDAEKEFCSEATLEATRRAGKPLLRKLPFRTSPDDLSQSPLIEWYSSIKTIEV